MGDCNECGKIHLEFQVNSLDREECGVKVLELKTSLPANPLWFVLRYNPTNLRILLHLLECVRLKMWIDTNVLRDDKVTFFNLLKIQEELSFLTWLVMMFRTQSIASQ